MRFWRADQRNIWRQARQFGAAPVAIAALLFGAVRCADLTAPAAVGNITIVYADPAYPSTLITQPVQGRRVDYAVGLELSPKFDVMIGSSVQPRARYVYSRASADSGRVAISQNGNAVRVIRPGIDTVIATVVGATIGGPTNGAKLADTILVFASADSLFVEKRNVTFTAITAVDTLDAAALATDNTPIPGVPIQWTSQNPAVVSVTQLGGGESAILQSQSNGTAVVRVQFAGFAFIDINVTVQQTFKRYFLSPPATAFASKTATASVTAVAQDSLNQTFVAGTPPAFQYVSSAPGQVSIDPGTGLMRAVDNTAGTDVQITAQISGVVASNTVTAAVAQDATTIDIQSQDPRTISSIGGTLSLGVIVRDALNQDWTKDDVLWTTSNSGKATATLNGLTTVVTAHDTGQVYVRAKADNAVDSILVIISNDPATVELSPDPFALTSLNQTGTLTATVRNAAGTTLTSGFTLTWISRDSNVVEPQPTGGQMLARNIGEARVVVTTNNNVSDSLTVRVTNAPDTVRIIPDTLFFSNVSDVNGTFAVDFKNGLGAVLGKSSVAWSTANANIAQVAVGTGAITAIGSGTTYVLAVSPENALRRDSVYVVVTNNAASMNVTPGTTQTLTALGATLPFSATVFNAAGNPISGAPVAWSVPVGGAFLSIDAVTGVATALANGTATVRATSGSVTREVTVNVAQAFSPTRSTITPAAASIVANGTSSTTISIQLKDANDNNLTFGGAAVVPSTSLGTLGGVTDAGNGLYTTTLTSSVTAGTANIGATVNAAAISGNGLVAFTAGAAAKYLVTSTSLTPVAGTSVTIRAQLADGNNNPVATAGNAVTFASTGGGSFTGTNPATTDATGVAQITFNTATTVSSHTVSATTGGLTGSSPAINSVAAAAANYLVTPATTSPAAGSIVSISAQLRDANGNAVAQPGHAVTWTKSDANGSFSGGGSSSTNAAGVATINLTTHTASATTTTVTATTAGVATGTSVDITTVPGSASAATTQITSDVAGVAAGGTATITVQARDANSNDLTASGGTVVLSTTAGSSLSAVIDNGNGSYTSTLSTTTVGPKTITGTINGQAIVDNAVVTVSVAGVSAAQSSASVPAGTAGAVTNIVVQARDQFGNAMGVGGSTVQVTVSGANTVATFTANDVGDGTYTAAYTPTVAGTDNVAITLGGTPISGSPYSSVVSAGALNNFVIDEGAVPNQVAGTPFNITIRARDASGNTVTTFSGGANTVDISSTSTLSAGSGTTPAFTNGALTRSVTVSNTGNFTITATRTGGGPAGTSNLFNVAPGAASLANSTIDSPETTRSAGQTAAITVTLRDGNNNPLTSSGGTVALTSNIGTLSAVTNNNNGTYSATFTATTVGGGTATISATLNGAGLTDTHVITVTVGAADPANTIITASPESIAADGAATSTISVAVRDAFGNPRDAGETVNLATTLGTLTANPATHVGGGVYQATLTAGLSSGNATITGTLNGPAITDNATVTLTPLAATQYSVTPSTLTAEGGASVLITAQLRDGNNNPVSQSGKTVNWTKTCNGGGCPGGAAGGSFASATSITDANGQAVVALTVSNDASISHTVTATDNTALTGTSAVIDVLGTTATISASTNTTEAALDNATITVDITNGQYVAALNLDGSDFTLTGAPAGVTIDAAVTRNSATSATIALNFSGTDFDVTQNISVNVQLSALATGTGATTGNSVAVSPTAASFVALTAPTNVAANTVSGTITLQARETNGTAMTVPVNEVFGLSSNSTSTTETFYSDAGGTNAITTATIASGQSTVTFFYRDDTPGTWTLTAADGTDEGVDFADATDDITVDATTATISASTNTTEATLDNGTLTIQIANGTFAATPVAGDFDLNNEPTGVTIASVTRNSDTEVVLNLDYTSADFDDSPAVTVNVNASALATGIAATTGNSVTFTPTAATTVVLTGPANVEAGAVSAAFSLEARETNGTSMAVGTNEVFALTSGSGGTFAFSTNSDGTGTTTTATIANGTSTATFYYTDNAAGGPYTITADDNPTVEGAALGSDTHDITVDAPATDASITSATPTNPLTEANLNGATVTVTIRNLLTFNVALANGDFTLNGAPAGTTITGVNRVSATVAILTLAFDGTDFDADATITVTVNQSALLTGTSATTGNSVIARAIVE